MGLDISAHAGIKPIKCDDYPDCDHLRPIVLSNFSGRSDGLDAEKCYEAVESEHCASFSYGGYSVWRDRLAELAGYEPVRDSEYGMEYAAGAWASTGGPFWELINFADNEGTIGGEVCTKLVKDFAEYDERAKAVDDLYHPSYFYEKYSQVRRAFELGARSGAVDFH